MSPGDAGDVYIHGHHPSVLRSHVWRTAENSAGYLLPHLRPGLQVLDVGCGPGTITTDLGRVVAPGRVLGIDRSAEPLSGARETAASAGQTNVTFTVGDVYALDLPESSVDVVHAHQVLQHLRDPVAALTEMRRVCRPGGLIAARDADYGAMTWFPDAGLGAWLDLYHQVARASGAEPDAGRRLRAWAGAAGLDEVQSTASVWCFSTEEDRHWWSSLWADRVTASTFAEQAVTLGLADAAGLADLAARWRAWGSAAGGWFAVLHGEFLARV